MASQGRARQHARALASCQYPRGLVHAAIGQRPASTRALVVRKEATFYRGTFQKPLVCSPEEQPFHRWLTGRLTWKHINRHVKSESCYMGQFPSSVRLHAPQGSLNTLRRAFKSAAQRCLPNLLFFAGL